MTADEEAIRTSVSEAQDKSAFAVGVQLEPGFILEQRIRIESVIHAGPMASIYKARHLVLERDVAVKTLNCQRAFGSEGTERFFREVRLVSSLEHPGIVKVHSIGLTPGGLPYFVMDFKGGGTLAAMQANGLLTTPEQFLDVCTQLLSALAYAHGKAVVHRDIKPGNIMVELTAGGLKVCLVDFGIARCLDEEQKLTRTGVIIGSPSYISPEQCMGKPADQRCDIYALGCVMYWLIAGKPPFRSSQPTELLRMHCIEAPPPLVGANTKFALPEGLACVVEKALRKEPAERYQDAESMCKDLEQIKLGLPVVVDGQHKPTQPRRLHLVLIAMAAAVVMLAASVAFWLYSKQQDAAAKSADMRLADRLVEAGIHKKRRRHWQTADDFLSRALAIYQKDGYEGDQLADIYYDEALCNDYMGRYPTAEAFFARALDYRLAHDPKDKDTASFIEIDWANCLRRQLKFDRAEPLLQKAVDYYASLSPTVFDRSRRYILALENLAYVQEQCHEMTAAAQSYEKVIAQQKRYNSSSDSIAASLRKYAGLLLALHRQAEAMQAAKAARQYAAKLD